MWYANPSVIERFNEATYAEEQPNSGRRRPAQITNRLVSAFPIKYYLPKWVIFAFLDKVFFEYCFGRLSNRDAETVRVTRELVTMGEPMTKAGVGGLWRPLVRGQA